MWSPNELLKIEKQRDILSYITLQFFHFKKVPLEHCPFADGIIFCFSFLSLSSYHSRFLSVSLENTCATLPSNEKWTVSPMA